MSDKVLRLGFVMGGGVSLGTFSGAALSEAIKQLIVYGKYDSGLRDSAGHPVYKPYSRVEIDIFSGASAGAISLAIMLRVLTNHRDKFKLLGYNDYAAMRQVLENKLLGQFGEAAYQIKMQNSQKFECLIAAQALQEFQEKIWSKEVDINKLLGTGPNEKDLSNNSGLLDRNVVDELGRKYIKFENRTGRLDHKLLLADRVLFACTLSNLNSISKKHKIPEYGKGDAAFFNALNDTAIDRVHSELRVFDLNFGEVNPATVGYYPLRWLQYHQGEEIQLDNKDEQGISYAKTIRNLEHNNAWREISATAIASAAFPFAFEPVVLNRFRHEFAGDWPEELKHKNKYSFTYFDGGTFNNEPIREGLRLATYIDHINSNIDFERMIVFVDPMVSEMETAFSVSVHDNLGSSRSLLTGKTKVGGKSTLMRLISKVPHLIAALLNEARGNELSNISSVLEQFEKRDNLRNFYKNSLSVPDDAAIIQMRNYAMQELDKIRKKLDLPPNTLLIQHELLRIIEEEKDYFTDKLPLNDKNALIDAMQQFVYLPKPTEIPTVKYWLYALSAVLLDIAMKLTGKAQNAKIVPIAPFDFYSKSDSYELMRLPGAGIAGFAGFASLAASNYEVKYGQYTAYRVLRELSISKGRTHEMALPAPFDYTQFGDGMKHYVAKAMMKRIREIIPYEYSTVLPFLEGYLESGILKFIQENIGESNTKRTLEFRIQVPNDTAILRGFNSDGSLSKKNSIEPVKLSSGYYLVAQLSYFPAEKRWRGDFVNSEQKLFIDKMRLFDNVPSVAIELPQLSESDEAFLSPNPMLYADARGHLGISGLSEMKQNNWKLLNEIIALDENLWGKDEIYEVFGKL